MRRRWRSPPSPCLYWLRLRQRLVKSAKATRSAPTLETCEHCQNCLHFFNWRSKIGSAHDCAQFTTKEEQKYGYIIPAESQYEASSQLVSAIE